MRPRPSDPGSGAGLGASRLHAADTRQRGTVLLIVMLLLFLVSAIVFAASTVVRVEVLVAERFRASTQAKYAAESGLALAVSELRKEGDWAAAVSGARASPLAAGAFGGRKAVRGGGSVTVCCGADSVAGRLAAETSASPRPARRAVVWRPFLWLPFDDVAGEPSSTRIYLTVFVGEDEEDAGGGGIEQNGRILVRSEATDPAGMRGSVEALVARWPEPGSAGHEPGAPPAGVAILTWREMR
jgi:hypothetical protein